MLLFCVSIAVCCMHKSCIGATGQKNKCLSCDCGCELLYGTKTDRILFYLIEFEVCSWYYETFNVVADRSLNWI